MRPGSSTDQTFRRRHKMRQSADYLKCYRRGKKRHGSLASLHIHRNDVASARLGITASRKVGKAVVRHRIKRRVREIFRRFSGRSSLQGLDLVVHLRPEAARSDFTSLKNELEDLLTQISLKEGSRRRPAGRQASNGSTARLGS